MRSDFFRSLCLKYPGPRRHTLTSDDPHHATRPLVHRAQRASRWYVSHTQTRPRQLTDRIGRPPRDGLLLRADIDSGALGGRCRAPAAAPRRARHGRAPTARRRPRAASPPPTRRCGARLSHSGRTRSASSQRRSSRPRRREPRRRGGSVRAAQPPSPCQRKFSGAARARTRARPSSGTAAAGMIICAQRDNESEPRVERAAHLRHGWVEDRGCAPAVSGLTSV